MKKAIFPALLLTAMVFLFVNAAAVPMPPSDLQAEFDPQGILISWQHPGGQGVYYKVYRSETETGQPPLLGTVEENIFLDTTVVPGTEYWYFINAADESGESISVKFSITNPKPEEKPFTITLLEPEKTTFEFGEQVEFVAKVESDRFEDLQNLRATLVSERLGLNKPMFFDSQKKIFSVSVQMPEQQPEGFSANYRILVSANVGEDSFSEELTHTLTLIPVKEIDLWQLTLNFFWLLAPVFAILAIGGAVVILWGAWSSRMKAERDRLRLELLEIQKERILWKHEVFKRRITPEQFREKDGELQGKQAAVEQKLGLKGKKSRMKVNIFQGFSPTEADEVMRIEKTMKKPAKVETQDSLRARLVGLGRSEKIAKKVAQLVFEKQPK